MSRVDSVREKLLRNFAYAMVLISWTHCHSEQKPPQELTEMQKADSIPVVNRHLNENKVKKPCTYSAAQFKKNMGIGVLAVYHPVNQIPLYRDPDLNDSVGLLKMSSGKLFIQIGQDSLPVFYFLHPTEYRPAMFILHEVKPTGVKVLFRNTKEQFSFWLPRSIIVEDKECIKQIGWELLMKQSTIRVADSIFKANPIKKEPNDTSETIQLSMKHPYIHVYEIRHPWIQVGVLEHHGGLYGSDSISEPIGWMKWYCGEKIQVFFPDTYTLEDYSSLYADE